MTKDLVVFGSFGFGNIGDEAVPLAIADLCRQNGVDCNIHVASRYDQPALTGVVGIGEKYRSELSRLAGKTVILSGGGIIEPRANACLLRYREFQHRVDPLSVSILGGSFEYGVAYGWRIKRQIKKILATMEQIYTRDYLSEIYLANLFPGIPVATLGDLVLGLMADRTWSGLNHEVADNDYIAVSLCRRWQNDPGWYDWIVAELVQLSNTYAKPLVFVALSQHFDSDQQEHQLLADRIRQSGVHNPPYVIDQLLDARQVASVYQNAFLTVSMRLHGCVMSYAQKTPFVGLCYHPKLLGFALTVGWGEFLLPKGLAVEQHQGRYGQAFSARRFKPNDLLECCDKALSNGGFNLLPLLCENLGSALEQLVANR